MNRKTALPRTFLILGLVCLVSCTEQAPSDKAETTKAPHAPKANATETPEQPKTKLSKAPTLRIPTVSGGVLTPLKGKHEPTLTITGTTASLNEQQPHGWQCDSPKCSLETTLNQLKLPAEGPLYLAFAPEVSAMGMAAWLKELSNINPLHVLGASESSSRKGILNLKSGRIFPYLFYPGSMKYALKGPTEAQEETLSKEKTGPKVSVRGGQLSIGESCNDKLLNRTTRRHLRHFVACYRTYSQIREPAEGSVNVAWSLGQDGRTFNPAVKSDDIKDEELDACLSRAIGTIPYTPSTTRGADCAINWTLKFKQRVEQEKKEGEAKKEPITETVIVTVSNKILTFGMASGGSKEVISVEKTEEIKTKLKSYIDRKPIVILTYSEDVVVQSIVNIAALASEAGHDKILLSHPRK